MKRYPEFIYNAIDKQNIVFANQLKMSDWNNIINVLKTQANANTTFLETWTRWFFGPKEYLDEDEYAIVPDNYTNYFDYLTGMFKEIDTRIKNEINDRTAADEVLRNYIDLNHGIAMEAISTESEQRIIADNSLREYTDLKHDTAMDAISEEIQQRILSDSALDSRIDTEKERVDSLDQALSNEVSTRETQTKTLADQSNRLDHTKLNKDFSGLSVAPTIHSDDTVIVRCAGCDGSDPVTYTIKIKTLMELMNSEVDYFKGYHKDISSLPTPGEPGDYAFVGSKDDEQYHMYVWDERDGGMWEETISGQYVLTSSFELFQQRLQEGSMHVGSIKGNTNAITDNTPLLADIEINGTTYALPTIMLNFLGDAVQGAYKLGAIKINGDTWNINNDIVEIEMSDENIDGAYELGSIVINGNKWNVVKLNDVLNKLVEFNNNANAYADTKATETLNAAKAYADATKNSILGEDISETYDTLKEIQDWIENEGVEATELSQAIANKQNKLTAGEGISISEDGVISVTFTPSTAEQWDGSYEEIVNGFTLTLNCDSSVLNNHYTYSLDDGTTWLPFTASVMILENVNIIHFKIASSYIAIGETPNDHNIMFSSAAGTPQSREITEDTIWYVYEKIDQGGSSD